MITPVSKEKLYWVIGDSLVVTNEKYIYTKPTRRESRLYVQIHEVDGLLLKGIMVTNANSM